MCNHRRYFPDYDDDDDNDNDIGYDDNNDDDDSHTYELIWIGSFLISSRVTVFLAISFSLDNYNDDDNDDDNNNNDDDSNDDDDT